MKIKITQNISSAAICVALFCAVALTARSDTITVTNINDSGPGSLRNALAIVNDGDTINFAVTGTIGLTSGELVVNNNITISGPGAASLAVNGNAMSRVFHIASARTVTISNLTIMNGRAPNDSGGGIYNDHATLTVTNCVVNSNAAHSGGGIANDGSNGSASAVINGTILSNNSCYAGGAIYSTADSGSAILEVTNSLITSNSTILFGGGIANRAGGMGGSGMLQITNSTLSNNSAGTEGGGIYSSDEFDLRSIVDVQITNSTLSANSATHNGGGIYSLGSAGTASAHISNSTLSGDSAGSQGGGICNSGGPGMAMLEIANSTLADNSAQSSGGGIYNSGFFGMGGSTYLANTALKAGAAGGTIFNDSGTVTSHGYNISSDNGGGYLTGPGDQINTDPM